ncbi:unnamed protein product [Schistosoma curassoni]|uniref:STAS domain-containing protein n=1 Tax=Schistosoma curassoni TaxID=6186 RepID=A0A183JZX4_9TREM|nr:unnamed protein product [Schistosoma curassoni]
MLNFCVVRSSHRIRKMYAIKLPNILILKYGGPLYYANSESFQNWIYQMTNINPHKLIKQRQRIKQQLDRKQQQQQQQLNEENLNQYQHNRHNRLSFVKNVIKRVKLNKKKDCGKFPHISQLTTDTNDSKNDDDLTGQLKFIILDISSWIYLDFVGMRTITDIIKSYAELDIRILFTICDPQIYTVLIRLWSPHTSSVWNEDFPTPLGGPSVSTNPFKASDIRFSSSQFRKQQ